MIQRVLPAPHRDVLYGDLLAAFQEHACAFCHLATHKSQRYVETLLHETVADVEHRDAWRAAKGFCLWHAQMALHIPHSAGSLAILYDDLLRHELAQVAALARCNTARHRWPWPSALVRRLRRWLQEWQQRPGCPACTLWQTHEQLYSTMFLDACTIPAFSQAFATSPGLCWSHLWRVVDQGLTHPNLAAVLAAQQTCLHPVQLDLQEFLRKLDYRFAHEPYGREADVWQRLVKLYTGYAPGSAGQRSPPAH